MAIVINIIHACIKRLQKALGDNIKRFENSNGEIKSKELPPIPLNFGPTGEA